jgi:MFS family permease
MQPLAPLVTALGIAQIVSWGTLFYAIAVLGPAMRRDLGVSELFVFGAFTAGLLVSGSLAPFAGRLVDRRGGRFALSIGSALAALSMAVLAAAMNPAMMVAGWLLVGAAMATCLYDPAFATLSQHSGARYRKSVTVLTLFGALASTVFWPLSHILVEAWGWRGAFGVYCALHLFVCLPLHLAFVPRRTGIGSATAKAQAAAETALASPAFGTPRLRWLTASFALSSFAFAVIAVHIVTLLTSAGLTAAQAVSLSMLVGPMQILGRGAELLLAGRVRAVAVGLAAYGFMLLAMLALVNVEGAGVAAVVFVVAYGCGNGIFTIVKGTAPAELFGRAGLGALLGHLARAALYARALAPASFSGMLAVGLGRNASLLGLGVVVLAALGCYALAIRPPAHGGEAPRDT